MTREQYYQLHRELWMWLSQYPQCNKQNWPRWERNGGDLDPVESDCFACEAAKNQDNFFAKRAFSSCASICLLNWGVKDSCSSVNGLFNQWYTKRDTVSKAAIALRIAQLPMRTSAREKEVMPK